MHLAEASPYLFPHFQLFECIVHSHVQVCFGAHATYTMFQTDVVEMLPSNLKNATISFFFLPDGREKETKKARNAAGQDGGGIVDKNLVL